MKLSEELEIAESYAKETIVVYGQILLLILPGLLLTWGCEVLVIALSGILGGQ